MDRAADMRVPPVGDRTDRPAVSGVDGRVVRKWRQPTRDRVDDHAEIGGDTAAAPDPLRRNLAKR